MSSNRYQPMLEFANLHLTFGDFVLSDWLEEVVLPAGSDLAQTPHWRKRKCQSKWQKTLLTKQNA